MTRPDLKTRMINGDRLLGVLTRMPAEDLVEMIGLQGFDFLVIDCEHGPADVMALRHHLSAAGLHDLPVLVRVGTGESALVLRALDQGAVGVIGPHVDSVEDARRLVDAAHYPPLGHRGFATYTRTGEFGRVSGPDHRRSQSEQTVVIGMIESPAGVGEAAGIAAVPGLDAIMIGAADLRASTTEADPDPAAGIATVNAVLRESDTRRLDIVGSLEAASAAFADGADLVVYNLAQSLMDHLAGLARATDPASTVTAPAGTTA